MSRYDIHKYDSSGIARRAFLGLSAGSLAALAGCASGNGSEDDSSNANTDADTDATGGSGSGESTSEQQTQEGETPDDESTSSSDSNQPAFEQDTGSHPYWIANPERNGYTAEYSGPGTDGEVLWQRPEQYNYGTSGSLLVINGIAYVASSTDVAAIDPNGNEQWSKSVSMEMDPTPFMFDDTLVLTTSSRVLGLNPSDGSRRWLQSLEAGYTNLTPVGKHNDRLLYVANAPDDSGLRVLWFDPFDQEMTRESGSIEKARAGGSRPILGDERLYLSGANMAVSLSDGSVSWDAEDRAHEQPYLLSNGQLMLATWEGTNVITDIRSLDSATGDTMWEVSNPAGSTTRSMAADETNVYTVGETKVAAYGLESGEQSWEQITASEIRTTSAVGGSNLYFITGDGQLHVLDTATGERLGRYQVNNMWGSLTVVGNRLYCNRTDRPSINNEVGQIIVIGPSEGD